MKTKEAKKLIGKLVKWNAHYCPKNGYGTYCGYVESVQGKNIEINGDWKWLPDLVNLHEINEGQIPVAPNSQ